MISLDTNYLLRFLTNDIKPQAQTAREVILSTKEVCISTLAIAETVYFLRNHYKKDKKIICRELSLLIKQPNIKVKNYVSLTLRLYNRENISIYDSFFIAEALEEGLEIKTFDQKLLKVFLKYRNNPNVLS